MRTNKTHEKYIKDLAQKNPNIEVIEEYINAHTKILHRCKIDNYEWRVMPTKVLEGKGCPVCAGKQIGPPPEYKNSIWASEYRNYFAEFLSEEQMKMFTPHSMKDADVICKHCCRSQKVKPKILLQDPSLAYECDCRGLTKQQQKQLRKCEELESLDVSCQDDIKRRYVVYMHVVPNGKRYIGITKNNPTVRWNNGLGYMSNDEFYNDILEYNWNNIEHYILFSGLTKKEALLKENELIQQYDTTNADKGYNKHVNLIELDDDLTIQKEDGTCTLTLRISSQLKNLLEQAAKQELRTLNNMATYFLVKSVNNYFDG